MGYLSGTKIIRFLTRWAVVCSLLGFLAPLWWAFDLFNHFRPQAVLAALTLLPLAWWVRDKKTMLLLVGVIALNLVPMTMRFQAFGGFATPESFSGKTVTVISANVLTSNTRYEEMVHLMQQEHPDIFIALETDEAWLKGLEPLQQFYPYKMLKPRPDNFGMAIYATRPFTGKVHVSGKDRMPILQLDFGTLRAFAVHPLPPISNDYARGNKAYLGDLATLVKQTPGAVIVAGDFNAALWSATMQPLAKTGLQTTNRHALAYSWPSTLPVLAVQIDHILTRGLSVISFDTLRGIGSDHFPVKAVLKMKSDRDS